MGRPIPDIRERMQQIADELVMPLLFPRQLPEIAAELRGLAIATWREPAKTNAPVQSRPMTRELAQRIKAFQAENPNMTQEQIGARFGVAGGRVSEALNGKWD